VRTGITQMGVVMSKALNAMTTQYRGVLILGICCELQIYWGERVLMWCSRKRMAIATR